MEWYYEKSFFIHICNSYDSTWTSMIQFFIFSLSNRLMGNLISEYFLCRKWIEKRLVVANVLIKFYVYSTIIILPINIMYICIHTCTHTYTIIYPFIKPVSRLNRQTNICNKRKWWCIVMKSSWVLTEAVGSPTYILSRYLPKDHSLHCACGWSANTSNLRAVSIVYASL